VAVRTAPRARRRRHRVRRLAGRRAHRARRRRPHQARAHRAPQLGAAVRGRHPQPAPAARPRPAGGRRRGHRGQRGRRHPISIATLPIPDDADYVAKGAHFGPHNLHENRPGSFQSSEIIFETYQNAGVRVYDIANAYAPKEIGAWVPPAPRTMLDVRPNRPQIIQSADVYVEPNGVVYLTDYNAGFYVLQFGG
jgi:hypothetical protein